MAHTHTLHIDTNYEKMVLWSVSGIIVVLLFTYSYFVNASVLAVVERKNIEKEISLASSRSATLEHEYFAQSEKINISLAHSIGFYEPRAEHFAQRGASRSSTLTLGR